MTITLRHLAFGAAICVFSTGSALAQTALQCDLKAYKAETGLTAAMQEGLLVVSWSGEAGAEMRARFALADRQPVVRDLAVRGQGGDWSVLGENLKPEYHVVSGIRRFSSQQGDPLAGLGLLTAERAEKEKWYAYRDAPLLVNPPPAPSRNPNGGPGGGPGGGGAKPSAFPYTSPKPEDIRRASASFNSSRCGVKTDGARIEVTFDGLSMGIFAGTLQFTAYRGTNLLRMDAVAKTDEPSVAYKYDAGLAGFQTAKLSRLSWNDVGGAPAQYRFGGLKNEDRVPVKADNRVMVAEGTGGSVAVFPMPHAFFWPRQTEINLGYVWYRKDNDTSFGMGVRQAEQEGVAQHATTFELYNAPPGTMQRMGMYFYLSPAAAAPTREAVMAFTHGDTFKPLPGYKTMVNHFHIATTKRFQGEGSLDGEARDVAAVKALGVNILGNSEFHGEGLRLDTGAGRFIDQTDYGLVSAKFSDTDFLVAPWEEPSAYFGGHYNIFWPKNVLWSTKRSDDQPFTETLPEFGKVYHVGNAAEMQRLLDQEDGYWYHAHPRTKGTAGYPDAIFDKDYVRNDRYLGVAYKMGMGMDLSEIRTCEWRCFDAIDTMNNMNTGTGLGPKYVIADIDSYQKGPEDDLYPTSPVTYIKLDTLPGATQDWSPILKSLRAGTSFVTTGEILLRNYAVEGTGAQRTVVADLEWTFPLEFIEVVWGDGKKVGRQTIRATGEAPHGAKRFTIPIDARGKSWVRFSAYDSAGNAAFAQPQWFNPANR